MQLKRVLSMAIKRKCSSMIPTSTRLLLMLTIPISYTAPTVQANTSTPALHLDTSLTHSHKSNEQNKETDKANQPQASTIIHDPKNKIKNNNNNFIKKKLSQFSSKKIQILLLDDTGKYAPANQQKEPFKNIQSALDDVYQDIGTSFNMALPVLTKIAQEAGKAVGYYDTILTLQLDNNKNIVVLLESVGEPVIVDNRFVEVRGHGSVNETLVDLQQQLKPQIGEVFHHGEFDKSKHLLEYTANNKGYFDSKWLSNSTDIILPDNTAEVTLIYETGDRYKFGEVIFFTLDKKTGKATTDPNKLPVDTALLRQLIGFKAGDNYDKNQVTSFKNNLAASKYFNNFKVDSILPILNTTDTEMQFESTINDNIKKNVSNNINQEPSSHQSDTLGELAPNKLNDRPKEEILQYEDTNYLFQQLIHDDDRTNILQDETLNALNFSIDDSLNQKYKSIDRKTTNLLRMPDNKVLVQRVEDNTSILGKVAGSVSDLVKTIVTDDIIPIDTLENGNSVTNIDNGELPNKKTANDVKQDKKVPLYVLVMSDKPHDMQVGIGYGTDTGARITAKLDNNLINREGYQAGIFAEWSKLDKQVGFHTVRPWKHPLDDVITGNIRYKEQALSNNDSKWSTQSLLASIARNQYSENDWNHSTSLRYRYDALDLGKNLHTDELNESVDLPVKFSSSNSQQHALLLGYAVHKTTADDLTNPSKGYRQHYGLEVASSDFASDADMVIAKAKFSGMYSFGHDDKHQLIAKLNGAYLWADDFKNVPYTLRFFAGGDQTIKGYDYNSLSPISKGYLTGGQVLAIANAEYNYEFKDGLRGALFTDIGNAYDKNFQSPTKLGVGFGVRWASPIGPVRVDIGAGITEESIPVRLHLFIGSPL